MNHLWLSGPKSHGLGVRAVTCEARGHWYDSCPDQMFFFSPRVFGGRNKMDPHTTNCVILQIHGDKKL